MANTDVDGSRALDEQLRLLQFMRSDSGGRWLALLEDNVSAGRSLKPSIIRILEQAETFYVTAEISDFLVHAAANTPGMTLREDMLPARAGFVLFEHPLPMPPLIDPGITIDYEQATIEVNDPLNDDIVAFGWMLSKDTDPDTIARGWEYGILLASFTRPDPRRPQLLRPALCYAWHFGMTQADLCDAQGRMEARGHHVGEDGLELNHEHWTQVRMRRANFFMGLLAFLKQRIMVTGHPRTANRATRKRMPAPTEWSHEPLIRVIEYRRRDIRKAPALGDGETSGSHELHYRWIAGAGTGGFWNHYHTKAEGYVAKWIMPFESPKNRPDLPLRQSRVTLNVVKR